MAQSDEVIRLLLDMGFSKENVQAVAAELVKLRDATQNAGQSYETLERQVGTYAVSTAQVASAEDRAVAAALEQTRAQKALQAVLEETSNASTKAGSKVAGMGQSMLQTGRVIQDFTQGGIGGVLNNIEGLSLALGGGPGLAGVLTALGVAAFVVGPQIKTLWASLTGGAVEKIPVATDAIDKYTEAIKRNKDELEELRKKQQLTLMEGIKYRDLVAETTKLEEEQANARASRSVTAYDNKADKARAGAFREAVGEYGGGEKLVQAMVDAGLPRKDAEARVADALKGDKLQIANIQNRSPDFKPFYTSPEEAERKKAQDKKTQENNQRNAHLTEQNLARNRQALRQKEHEDDQAKAKMERVQAELDRGAQTAQDKEHAENTKKVGGTDIDEQAHLAAAEMRAAGGYVDKFGRERQLSPAQQEQRLKAMVDFEIRRRFPAMNKEQRDTVATETARGAEANVQDRLQAAQAMAGREGLNANQATLQAMQSMIAEFSEMAQRARMQASQARGLQQRNQPAANGGWN